MTNSLKDFAVAEKKAKTETSQTKRTPGRKDEVKNNAGGYVFKVSDSDRLERFLILGTDGATYYVNSKTQVKDNVKFLRKFIEEDDKAVVDALVDVSVNGRAYKNSPAIFALALVLSTDGTDKAYARAAVSKVVRTGTHLFEFATYIDNLGGWGRAKRSAIAEWYTGQDAGSLAYQAVKYRQRDGWTHRDLFRKSHPQGVDVQVGNFILGKPNEGVGADTKILDGFKKAQEAGTVKETVNVLRSYKSLPWEALKTEHLKSAEVWKTLFYNNQLNGQALVRNITRIAKLGLFEDMQFAADYAGRLTDEEMIRKTRLHPINLLNAIVVYTEGQVPRGQTGYYYGRTKEWTTESVILNALNQAFYTSFKTIEPAGKRTMLAVDVSGSMGSPAIGLDLTCAQVSGAMAMTIARSEPAHIIRGFTSEGGYYNGTTKLTDLQIGAGTELSTAMQKVKKSNFGGTDCALPMVWALENNVAVDTFVVITDSETYAGKIKPSQALVRYRKETGIDARLAVLGVASTGFTIADPSDKGQMDFVGFDSNAPRVLADFSAGRI